MDQYRIAITSNTNVLLTHDNTITKAQLLLLIVINIVVNTYINKLTLGN